MKQGLAGGQQIWVGANGEAGNYLILTFPVGWNDRVLDNKRKKHLEDFRDASLNRCPL